MALDFAIAACSPTASPTDVRRHARALSETQIVEIAAVVAVCSSTAERHHGHAPEAEPIEVGEILAKRGWSAGARALTKGLIHHGAAASNCERLFDMGAPTEPRARKARWWSNRVAIGHGFSW
jgi:hypothetical protein